MKTRPGMPRCDYAENLEKNEAMPPKGHVGPSHRGPFGDMPMNGATNRAVPCFRPSQRSKNSLAIIGTVIQVLEWGALPSQISNILMRQYLPNVQRSERALATGFSPAALVDLVVWC